MRAEVLARNNGRCMWCGIAQATEAHHAMVAYACDEHLRADQLVGLCGPCHGLSTSARKFEWRNGQGHAAIVADLLADHLRSDEFRAAFVERRKEHSRRRFATAEVAQGPQRDMQSRPEADTSIPARAEPERAAPVERERPDLTTGDPREAPQRQMRSRPRFPLD